MDFDFIGSVLEVEYHIKIVIIILILLLNGFVVVIFVKMEKTVKWRTSNILLLNQTMADTTVCIPLMLHVLPQHIQHEIWPHGMAFVWYTIFVSVGSVLLNTFDRYVTLKKPLSRLTMNSKMRLLIAILSVWILSALPAVASAIAASSNIDDWKVYWSIIKTLSIILFLLLLGIVLIIIGLLILSARVLERNVLDVHARWKSFDAPNDENKRGMMKLLSAMIIVHAVTTFPWIIVEIIYAICGHRHDAGSTAWSTLFVLMGITYILYSLSAVVKPLLTIFLNQDYNNVLPPCSCSWKKGTLSLLRYDQDDDNDTVSMVEIEKEKEKDIRFNVYSNRIIMN